MIKLVCVCVLMWALQELQSSAGRASDFHTMRYTIATALLAVMAIMTIVAVVVIAAATVTRATAHSRFIANQHIGAALVIIMRRGLLAFRHLFTIDFLIATVAGIGAVAARA